MIKEAANFRETLMAKGTARCKSLGIIALASLVVGLALPAVAKVDVDYFDLPPEQLLNANVTSVLRRAEKLSEAPAAVYIISQEDIQRAGVQTIPEALRMAPGVQVAQADSNTRAITIRGFNGALTNKLLALVDGRTVYNPLFAGTYIKKEVVEKSRLRIHERMLKLAEAR
jgi:iron complex outermembrane receptor protein